MLETSPLLKFFIFENEREMWVNQIYREREKYGEFYTLFPQLLKQPRKFFQYFRMTPATFWYILNKIRNDIEKHSNFRRCISPEEKLAVTLR